MNQYADNKSKHHPAKTPKNW